MKIWNKFKNKHTIIKKANLRVQLNQVDHQIFVGIRVEKPAALQPTFLFREGPLLCAEGPYNCMKISTAHIHSDRQGHFDTVYMKIGLIESLVSNRITMIMIKISYMNWCRTPKQFLPPKEKDPHSAARRFWRRYLYRCPRWGQSSSCPPAHPWAQKPMKFAESPLLLVPFFDPKRQVNS